MNREELRYRRSSFSDIKSESDYYCSAASCGTSIAIRKSHYKVTGTRIQKLGAGLPSCGADVQAVLVQSRPFGNWPIGTRYLSNALARKKFSSAGTPCVSIQHDIEVLRYTFSEALFGPKGQIPKGLVIGLAIAGQSLRVVSASIPSRPLRVGTGRSRLCRAD